MFCLNKKSLRGSSVRMATHFVCQSTEPLPHVYQSGLANLSHGAVSQYEVFNDSKKPHTQFPPPGWDFSQTSEEDSLPLVQAIPQPEWKNTSFHPDPDLCITPQKPRQPVSNSSNLISKIPPVSSHEKPDINPDPLLTVTPERPLTQSYVRVNKDIPVNAQGKKHRVRFDVEEDAEKWEDEDSFTAKNMNGKIPQKSSPEKVYQPELYGNDDDNFEFGNEDENPELKQSKTSKTVRYTVSKANNQVVYVPLPEKVLQQKEIEPQEKLSDNTKKSTQHTSKNYSQTSGTNLIKVIREKPKQERKSETNNNKDPIASSVVPEQSGPKRKVKVLRENQYMPKDTEYTYPFNQDPLEFAGGEEHTFARPEYNSTLRMKIEAEKLKNSSIDIERALQKKLTMSESTKTSIHENAAAQVNSEGKTFSGLVSLNVPVDELCKHVEDQKTSRAKQVKISKKKLTEQKQPDLMDFFTDDRQKESVIFTMPGISAPSEKLSTVSHRRAFDLYKHNRVWEKRGYRK